jgi:hypothetical protein
MEEAMAGRRGGAVVVLASFENDAANRCVDLFVRGDGSYGFEEYRRDPEDGGGWTPVTAFAGLAFPTRGEAVAAARGRIVWFRELAAE